MKESEINKFRGADSIDPKPCEFSLKNGEEALKPKEHGSIDKPSTTPQQHECMQRILIIFLVGEVPSTKIE